MGDLCNEALEREPYHTHSVDLITAKPKGITVFTIVDFKKGYWMVVLYPDSRKLTYMVLPFGRFQWTRLPMDTVVAQDIFQSKLDSIFIGMGSVTGIADDMVIAGRDEMKHDRNATLTSLTKRFKLPPKTIGCNCHLSSHCIINSLWIILVLLFLSSS